MNNSSDFLDFPEFLLLFPKFRGTYSEWRKNDGVRQYRIYHAKLHRILTRIVRNVRPSQLKGYDDIDILYPSVLITAFHGDESPYDPGASLKRVFTIKLACVEEGAIMWSMTYTITRYYLKRYERPRDQIVSIKSATDPAAILSWLVLYKLGREG